ncbi:MAG: DMT family transporter [Chloroflexi bacterium]|nr:DMT family transporter [Chloroflexota bacterium]
MVAQSVALGVLAALGWGIADFLVSMLSRRLGVVWTALGVHLVAVGATTIYLLLADDLGRISPAQWGLLAGMGMLAFTTYLAFYRALQLGPVAIVSPIGGSYAVVVILLAAVFAGERLNVMQMIGAAAGTGGVVLASLNFRSLSRGQKLIGAGILFGVAATLGLGVWQYALGALSRELGWFLPIYASRLMTLAFLLPTSLLTQTWKPRRFTKPALALLALAAIVETGGLFAFTRGTEIGVISIVAAASTAYPALPVLGGLFIYRERLAPSQWLGLAIILAGLIALALSS